MNRKCRAMAALLAVLMAFTCVGCVFSGVDSLYALPQLADEYVGLEALIARRIRSGEEYAAPVGGRNRQTVQLRDLDGDGVSEAIAFLADESHTPLVCVYRQDAGGSYYLFVAIEGVGNAVGSVEYADLTGNGADELILAWQISGDMRLLAVYSLREEEQAQLLSADSAAFAVSDLDGDEIDELMNLTLDRETGAVARYDFSGGGEYALTEAPLSEGIGEVQRVREGLLSDGAAALFVESLWGEDELITDVFTASGGQLSNITLGSGGRSGTLRRADAFAEDIDGDRALEIPESSGDALNWYRLNASGQKELALSTYHDYDDGWYLVLTEELLSGGVTAFRSDTVAGESSVTLWGDGGQTPLVAIYTLTGENRLDRAGEEGRFLLSQDGATVYAASILEPERITEDEITENFHLIYQDWQSGVL